MLRRLSVLLLVAGIALAQEPKRPPEMQALADQARDCLRNSRRTSCFAWPTPS